MNPNNEIISDDIHSTALENSKFSNHNNTQKMENNNDDNISGINERDYSNNNDSDKLSISSSMQGLKDVDDDNYHIGNKNDYNENLEQSIKSQIISAAQHGDIKTLTFYLVESTENLHPLSPNLTDSDGITLVHWAALNNKLSTVKFLVSIGADPDVPAGDMNATPLLWAVRYGLVYVADWLIREGKVKVDVTDKNGIGILLASVFSSNVMMVVYVIWTLNENHNLENNNIGLTGINTTDEKGRTPLHWAAYQGDFLTVDVLILAGANVDVIDNEGFTPLHWGLVSNSRSVISSLVNAKCNINTKTQDGKNAWNIASDMKCSSMWFSILKENNRNIFTGEKIENLISEEWAKTITFLMPYLNLPIILTLASSKLQIILKLCLSISVIILQQLILKKIILPCYNKGKINILKTPFLSGVFSSTVFICLIIWLCELIPYTIMDENIANFIFLVAATGVVSCFIKVMIMDPGYIPKETDYKVITETVYDLLELRQFDSHHYCIYTNIRKPLRSKYSKDMKRNIARFDHYCPWVNNNIGIRNHKIFIAFTVFLEISIICWINLVFEYFDELPEIPKLNCHYLSKTLCNGYYKSRFTFYFLLWVILQLFWLSILLIVQFIQISKGSTTYEFSNAYKITLNENSFSSVPNDEIITSKNSDNFDRDDDDVESMVINSSDAMVSNLIIPGDNSNPTRKNFIGFILIFISKLFGSKLCRLVGLDQMVLVTNDLIHKNEINDKKLKFNYGFMRNWLDFLFLRRVGDGYSLRTLIAIPLKGEGNLNDTLVDYYKLYSLPESV